MKQQLLLHYLTILVVGSLYYNVVRSFPLDIIAGKSGEEQVKEALDRAEKESEQAAKERNDKSITARLKQETEEFLSSDEKESDTGSKLTRSSTDLKATLDKKVEELAKFHEKHAEHKPTTSNLIADKTDLITQLSSNKLKPNELSELAKGDKELTDELNIAENKEKENAALEDESDKKMVEMAKKLNNLVLKFQKKMGRLQHRPKNAADLLPEKDQNDESTVKSIRGKPATHAPIDLAALKNALGLLHTSKSDSETGGSSSATAATSATGSLGMKSSSSLSKDKSALGGDHNQKLPYKEDTKLEDRLAMEAEEEKKFSNGDTYDDGEGEEKSSATSKDNSASSLSPKEQASQEMQSYNALISTESNRELSQIQEEITKATQSSMGQVSVVGQKEQVNTEPPSLPNLGSLGGSDSGGAGGLDNSFTAALGGVGGLDGLSKSVESLGGGVTDQFQGLQSGSQPSTENIEPSSSVGSLGGTGGGGTGGAGESSTQQASSIGEQNLLSTGTGQTSDAGGAAQLDSNQQPIDIGGSQEPVEMGTLNSNNNLFAGAADQLSQSVQNSLSSSFGGGSQQPIEIGGGGGGGGAASQPGMLDQQQSMSFKKSKISGEKMKMKTKRHKASRRKSKHKT